MINPRLAENLRLPSGIGLYRQPRDLLAVALKIERGRLRDQTPEEADPPPLLRGTLGRLGENVV
jgi:hypothetical protein